MYGAAHSHAPRARASSDACARPMGKPALYEHAPAPSEDVRTRGGATHTSGETPHNALRGDEPWPASLEPSCLAELEKLSSRGVALSEAPGAPVFTLSYGGAVANDGSCLWSAVKVAAGLECTPAELRHRVVKRVLADAGAGLLPREMERQIETTHSPDMTKGWGVQYVQERKLVLRAMDVPAATEALDELVQTGMTRSRAAELVYGERATPVNDVQSWAQYMACDGLGGSEYRCVALKYCEDGLLDAEEDLAGHVAAFGDELALCGLATELRRSIHVVQVHGADAGFADEAALFFLPHHPLAHAAAAAATAPPLFLIMRGTGWTGSGGDHFEPCLAHAAPAGTVPAFTL